MSLRTIIFINILFITNLLFSMEILKNILNRKHINNNPITIALLFAYNQQKILPKDITNYILHYCINLKYEDFIYQSQSFKSKWFKNNTISIDYFYLTTKQKNLMNELIKTEHSLFNINFEVSYFLPSTKEYKRFLTLPLPLRQQLASFPFTHTITATKTIFVKTYRAQITDTIKPKNKHRLFFGYVARPVL